MVKEKKKAAKKKHSHKWKYIFLFLFMAISIISVSVPFFYYEKKYSDRIFPGINISGIGFGGRKVPDVENYFKQKNLLFSNILLTLSFEDKIATLSASDLSVSYDGKLSGAQAYSLGRSGQFLSDTYQKWRALTTGINLPSVLNMNNEIIEETLTRLSQAIDIPAEDALFQFEKGKVVVFKISKPGRALNIKQAKQLISSYINAYAKETELTPPIINIELPVDKLVPAITTENSNNFGIKELIGYGSSKFHGSIPGRIHNVNLAASKIHGHLIPPGTEFSFNNIIGDISASTGFQPAYIIKGGRTVLGDGGGVCQVSTTLFRAALNSGLPITERHAHAYRVHYYEEESPVGIDATVFAPSYDLKFKNDTSNYILIQSKTDLANYSLDFYFYGTIDGRTINMTKPVIYGQAPPPPDLYQDDPTLPVGVVKQVDWSASGAKTNFDYSVEKNGEILTKQSFFSNFKPWQAVFLKGTKQ